uniref:(California timema) hypothetical protein n=1 Tax=Timema californicum TaxID=61474 RepID=A0A7R9J7E5_TIMCA|nr:unnamed protein product [Timema californicum]
MANSALGGMLAFVTGAGSGIGRAVCQVLAREGAKVIATDKDEKSAQKTLSLLKSSSATSQHLHLPLDVSRSEEVYSVVKSAIEHFSVPPTIVVNCAGITRDNFLLKLDEDSFQQVIDVNLKGTFLVTQTIARALVEANITGGSIINLASIVGRTGNIGQCSYAASKAAIEAFTKTTAKELGTKNINLYALSHPKYHDNLVNVTQADPWRNVHRMFHKAVWCSSAPYFGIRCNAVVPGFIHTPMTDAVPDKVKEKFRANIALRRFGKAEEVAEVIAFLASDKSSYVNGASIEVIGG